jgi:RNA polymerase sigma-70 factor (ECF subfamily)
MLEQMIEYEKYIAPIFRFIYFRVKNHQEAEDLTQTVFLKAWKGIGKYKKQNNPFSSWLYTIARNTIIDYWKKKKELNLDEGVSDILDDGSNVLQEIENESDFQQIMESIIVLTEDQQEIIILKFIEDLSNKEISEILSKNEDAVRQLQSRALKSLKNILEEKYA